MTGDIKAFYNTLIPSTVGALTSANYRRKKPLELDSQGARLFSARLESGVVTHATWQMIHALPPALRADYERLTAESLVFYPRKLVVNDGADYDRLISTLSFRPMPWEAEVDLGGLKKTTVEPLDSSYASLRFPVGAIALSMARSRRQARRDQGKGSGLELAWKLQANTIYGVLASSYQATSNAVAGNVITAAGRAGAYALIHALNGIQVITDGCTYRRDQVPACTFAECLELQPDYSLAAGRGGRAHPVPRPSRDPGR